MNSIKWNHFSRISLKPLKFEFGWGKIFQTVIFSYDRHKKCFFRMLSSLRIFIFSPHFWFSKFSAFSSLLRSLLLLRVMKISKWHKYVEHLWMKWYTIIYVFVNLWSRYYDKQSFSVFFFYPNQSFQKVYTSQQIKSVILTFLLLLLWV